MEKDKLYLENIEQWLEDQNVVTYKWISLNLSVSADTAKQMLYNYSQKHQNIQILYMLSGIEKEGGYSIKIVPADKLQDEKKKLSNITSLHIYSLQQKVPNTSTMLYTIDQDYILNKEKESNHDFLNDFVTNKWSGVEFKEGSIAGEARAKAEIKEQNEKKENKLRALEVIKKDEESRQEKLKRKSESDKQQSKLTKKKSGKNLKAKEKEQKGNLNNFFISTKESKNSKGYLVIEDVKEEIPIKTEEPNKENEDENKNENKNETEANPVKDFFNLKEKEITPPKKKRKQPGLKTDVKQA